VQLAFLQGIKGVAHSYAIDTAVDFSLVWTLVFGFCERVISRVCFEEFFFNWFSAGKSNVVPHWSGFDDKLRFLGLGEAIY
jgi:hypothetical protein